MYVAGAQATWLDVLGDVMCDGGEENSTGAW